MSIPRRTGVIPAENVWMSGHHGVLSNRCLSKRNKFNRDPQDWIDLAAAEARCGGGMLNVVVQGLAANGSLWWWCAATHDAGSIPVNQPSQSAITCLTFGHGRGHYGLLARPARPEATHQHSPLGVPCQKPTGESRAVSLIHSPPSTNQCT